MKYDMVEKPPYLDIYPKAILNNNIFTVIEQNKEVSILDWIEK